MKYQERFSVNDGVLKAPFPWFGGKSRVASLVWERFGDVTVYAEPFAGSLAVLLGRPEEHERTVESVNDKDGFVCNAWRAIIHDPEQTAHWADWPSFENDLHARHAWLVERRSSLVERLEADPDYFDAKIAGWWLWGIANWIGGGWCVGNGPWKRVEVAPGDWRLRKVESDDQGVSRRRMDMNSTGRGVSRRLMEMGSAGRGINRQRLHMVSAGQGVSRRLLYMGDAGRGVKRRFLHMGNADQGVNRKCQNQSLVEYFDALSARLRNVRVSCGDWSRILTPAALSPGVGGVRGIFLDPPYSADAERAQGCYTVDDYQVAHAVREWCIKAPREYRIALCGYEGEGHEILEREHGWSCVAWTAGGGMQRNKHIGGNRTRERIWFSPACLTAKQLSLLG
jgi:hypothetical protein